MLVCSSNQAFGRATVEAMKLAKRVTGAYAGSTQDLIQGNPALRIKLEEKGRDWAADTFTIENYTSDLLEAISKQWNCRRSPDKCSVFETRRHPRSANAAEFAALSAVRVIRQFRS